MQTDTAVKQMTPSEKKKQYRQALFRRLNEGWNDNVDKKRKHDEDT